MRATEVCLCILYLSMSMFLVVTMVLMWKLYHL